jgi:hypothetical protein
MQLFVSRKYPSLQELHFAGLFERQFWQVLLQRVSLLGGEEVQVDMLLLIKVIKADRFPDVLLVLETS